MRYGKYSMNTLELSLIEKAGYGNGLENVRESTTERTPHLDAHFDSSLMSFDDRRHGLFSSRIAD